MKNEKKQDYGVSIFEKMLHGVNEKYNSGGYDAEFPYIKTMTTTEQQRFKDFHVIADLKNFAVKMGQNAKSKHQDNFESLKVKIIELQTLYDLNYLQNV